MKKNIFIISCLMITQFISAQAPGGVSGAVAWYKANAGLTNTTWADQSGNGYSLSRTSAPAVNNRTMNFNPVACFGTSAAGNTANSFGTTTLIKSNWPGSSSSSTYYYVSRDIGITGVGGAVGMGSGTTGIHSGRASAPTFTYVSELIDFSNPSIAIKLPGTQNTLGAASNNGINIVRFGYDSPQIRLYGAIPGTTLQGSTGVTPNYVAPSVPFRVGANGINSNPWKGDIAEVIVYPTRHVAANYVRIESYLALKYGITKPGDDYIASNGTIYWNRANNTGYVSKIAGIGRDDASGLHQKQSQSTGSNTALYGYDPIIGNNNTILPANTSNGSNDIAENNSFMTWASNGVNSDYFTGLQYFKVDPINVRMGAVWKIQETGTIGSVKIAFMKSQLYGTNQSLIVSHDGTIDSTDTIIPLNSETIDGVEYWVTNYDFANNDHFTYGSYVLAPGGVATNIGAWYKADGTISATRWDDETGKGKHMLAAGIGTGSEASMPVLEAAPGIVNNFNPRVAFLSDQNNARKWTMTQTGNDVFPSVPTDINGSIYNISSFPSTTVFDLPQVYSFQDDNPGLNFGTDVNANKDIRVIFQRDNQGTLISGWDFVIPGQSQTKPILTGQHWRYGASSNNFSINGYGYAPATNTITASMANRYIFGSENTTGTGFPNEANSGYISENVVYTASYSAASEQNRRINTYFAIKYGITLRGTGIIGGGGGNASFDGINDYVLSNGSVIWAGASNTAYHNNIAAIGYDPLSDLKQKQSISVNAGDQVIFGKGTVAASNQANTNNFTEEQAGQFLIWGDNNASGTTSFGAGVPSFYTRLARTWAVKSVGGYAHNTQLLIPTSILDVLPAKTMIMNQDAAFPAVTNTAVTLNNTVTIEGKSYYVVNLAASQTASDFYFTFSGFRFDVAAGPGGVPANYWLRADKDVVTDGSGKVTNWKEQVLGRAVTQAGTNTNLPSLATNPSLYNFNPYVDFSQTTQALGNLTTSLFNASATTMSSFTVTKITEAGGYSGRFFGVDFNLPSTTASNTRFDWQSLHNGKYTSRGETANSNTYLIATEPTLNNGNIDVLHTTVTPATFQNRLNGSGVLNNLTGLTNYIGKGGYLYGSNLASLGGDDQGTKVKFAEHAIFERTLSDIERRQVESYMSIKYGTSINDFSTDPNYRDALGNPTFTIDPTYRHVIFGLAKEQAAGIDRRISKSVHNDMLTVSTDANFTNLNDTHADNLTDGQYLIFSKNDSWEQGIPPDSFYGSLMSGNNIITASDGTEFDKLLSTRWKVQDKGGVGCVNLHFRVDQILTEVYGWGHGLYLVVADDANFTQNVVYKQIVAPFTGDGQTANVAVNFGNNTNGSASTGNYFTLASAPSGSSLPPTATPSDLNTVVSGVNTIPSATEWKPTVPNAYLEINSNSKGMVVSRVANTAAIANPIAGMMIYDLSASNFKVYTGTAWRVIGASTGSGVPSSSKVRFCD